MPLILRSCVRALLSCALAPAASSVAPAKRKRATISRVAALCAALLTVAQLAAAAGYPVTVYRALEITPVLEQTSFAAPYWFVNGRGDVLGVSYLYPVDPPFNKVFATHWQGASATNLEPDGTLRGVSYPVALNDSGTAVVWVRDRDIQLVNEVRVMNVETPGQFGVVHSGFDNFRVAGMNNAGVIAGHAYNNSDPLHMVPMYAFGADSVRALPLVDGATSCQVFDINQAGTVLARMLTPASILGTFLYDDATGWTRVPARFDAVRMNDYGLLVGSDSSGALAYMALPDSTVHLLPGAMNIYDYELFEVAVNNAGVIVSSTYTSPPTVWLNGQPLDLNALADTASQHLVLTEAIDISESGVVVGNATIAHPGGFPEVVGYSLQIPTLLRPAGGELLVSGTSDSVRWYLPNLGGTLHVQLANDFGPDAGVWQELGTASVASGKFTFVVPDTVSTHCRIRLVHAGLPGDGTLVSPPFRMKPYLFTKIGPDGNYLPFRRGTDNWYRSNSLPNWWPESWWGSRFFYDTGNDPFTNDSYPQGFPYTNVFAGLYQSTFPDWPLFVEVFGPDACYWSTGLGIYSPTAIEKWTAFRMPTWGGSCGGMSASEILRFARPDLLHAQFPQLIPVGELFNAEVDDTLRLVVNNLQTAQVGAARVNWETSHSWSTIRPLETIHELKRRLRLDQPDTLSLLVLVNQQGPAGAHAVVPLRVDEAIGITDTLYTIRICDPNFPDEPREVTVRTSPLNPQGHWEGFLSLNFDSLTNNEIPWGGDTGIYLSVPLESLLGHQVFPAAPLLHRAGPTPMSTTADPGLIAYCSTGGDVAITSASEAGTTGIVNDQLVSTLASVLPIPDVTGQPGPPAGYAIVPGSGGGGGGNRGTGGAGIHTTATSAFQYVFDLAAGEGPGRALRIFRSDGSVTYERAAGAPTLTDRVIVDGSVTSGGCDCCDCGAPWHAGATPAAAVDPLALTVVGDASGMKSVTMRVIGKEADHEKMWDVRHLQIAEGSSLQVGRANTEVLSVVNNGTLAQSCDLALARTSALGAPGFLTSNVSVPAGASLDVIANWNALDTDSVMLALDLDRDGTPDVVTHVGNELTATGVEIPEQNGVPAVAALRTRGVSRGAVECRLGLPKPAQVTVRAFDLRGRLVRTLDPLRTGSGWHAVSWDGRDGAGRAAASGVYVLRAEIRPLDGSAPLTRTARVCLVQ